MENGMDPRLALGAAEQQELAARRGMAENLAQGGADDEARRAKMRQACEGFESIFIQKMWEQMRATLPKEGLMKSKEEEFWMSMYDQELARSVTSAGGIGLADMMMRQMSRNEANIGEASRISPSRRPELNVEPAPLLPSSGSGVRSGRDAAAAASVESSPAGAFTRAAERRSSPANPAIPSIYDGEAPAEGVGDAPAENTAATLPGALPARAETSSAAGRAGEISSAAASRSAVGNTERGAEEEAPVPASGISANDPVRQTLDELRNTVAASAPAAPARPERSAGRRDVHVSLASASNPRLALQQMKGEAPVHGAAPGSVSGRPENPRAQNAAASGTAEAPAAEAQPAPTVIRVRYQTNLPPNQRSASAEKMLQAMREAQRPVPPRAISSGSPYEAEPARTAAPAAQPVSMPVPESVPAPERAEAKTPADPLAGIQPRFVPSRFSNPLYASRSEAANFAVSMTGAVRPSLASVNTTMTALAEAYPVSSGLPDMAVPVQSGGPALSAPEAVRGAVALGNPAPARGSLEAPVSGDISSGFGWRADPFTGRRSWHAGVDIKAEPGEAVRAARGGVVSFAGAHPELGNLVVVEHGDGLRTFYGHNRSIEVRAGQTVSTGTELARAGASGRASGTHVHFEVRRGDLALNPEPLIRQADTLLADAR